MPTNNPVPSTDPSDLLFNAGKLDEVVNGSAQYYTDRLGVNRRTVEGISAAADVVLAGLGYAPPVAYAAGISLTLTTQTVEYAGEVYAPKVADLPFTTSGTFETAKFRLIQGVAAVDLAAGGGASLVGYMPAGTGAVATTVQSKLRESVSVFDFMTAAQIADVQAYTGLIDVKNAVQAAVTSACTAQKTLLFPAGQYSISGAITFPNKSFIIEGEGPTATVIKAFLPTGLHDLFDFSGTSGPAKVLRNISFEGPSVGVYGTGTAIKAATNGLYIDNVWMRGIYKGIEATGSFINCNQCVAEYCFLACSVSSALDESIWYGWTFYRNETDISVGGSQKSFIIRDFTSIGTKTDVLLVNCSGLMVDGVTVQNDGTAWTPNIVHVYGGYNQINNVKIYNFGAVGLFLDGASAIKNRISNLVIEGVPKGIYASSAKFNTISNFLLKGCTSYGIQNEVGGENEFKNFRIESCAYGAYLYASDFMQLIDGVITGSTNADFYYPTANIIIIITSNVAANFAAISSIQYFASYTPSGNMHIVGTPSGGAVAFKVGDTATVKTPVVGSPKGYMCTVAGAPGTWVSTGNL